MWEHHHIIFHDYYNPHINMRLVRTGQHLYLRLGHDKVILGAACAPGDLSDSDKDDAFDALHHVSIRHGMESSTSQRP